MLNSKQNTNNNNGSESLKLKEEISQKEKEIERLTSGIQKSFSKFRY